MYPCTRVGYFPMRAVRFVDPDETSTDAELMQQLAAGIPAALDLLHRRYAAVVYGLAARSLDRATAEEIVQDVFLLVWQKAAVFDPGRGQFRPWVLQMAHFRILNELRRRSRRPQLEDDPDGDAVSALPDRSADPVEAAWRTHRRAVLRSALAELPAAQQEALDMAVLQERTHEEVAARLDVPLGTAKTRIRTGLQKLRRSLGGQMSALGALVLLIVAGGRYLAQRRELALQDRALTLVTASDVQNLRLAPLAGVSSETHARYRGRSGTALGVITLSHFPPLASGEVYRIWVRHGAVWTSLGTVVPDDTGAGRVLSEDPSLVALPDAIEIRREAAAPGAAPAGAAVVVWSAP